MYKIYEHFRYALAIFSRTGTPLHKMMRHFLTYLLNFLQEQLENFCGIHSVITR